MGSALRTNPIRSVAPPDAGLDSTVIRTVSGSDRMSKMMGFPAPSAPSRLERQALATAENGLYVDFFYEAAGRVKSVLPSVLLVPAMCC